MGIKGRDERLVIGFKDQRKKAKKKKKKKKRMLDLDLSEER